MRKIFGLLMIMIAAAACKSHNNLSNDSLRQYFQDSILHNPAVNIDSFGLVKIDTLTAKKIYQVMDSTIQIISMRTQTEIRELKDTIAKHANDTKIPANRKRVDSMLLSNAQVKYTAAVSDMNRLDSLAKQADSVTTLAYIARCFYKLTNNGPLSVNDNVTINLNPSLQYIRKAELKKLLPTFIPTSWAPKRQQANMPQP